MENIYRGDIFYIEPYPTEGSEQRAGRPAIVVSNDMNNNYSSTVEIVYLTTQPKNDLPTHVIIRSTGRDSTALCEQITSVSKERFGNYVCSLTDDELRRIEIALMISLAIDGGKEDNIAPLPPKAPPAPTPEPVAAAPAPKTTAPPPSSIEATTRAKLEAERDIYKTLYENLLTRLLPAERAETVMGARREAV